MANKAKEYLEVALINKESGVINITAIKASKEPFC